MNYQAINTKVTALITSLGFPITVTRSGAVVGKGNGVITPSSKKAEQGATSPSPMSVVSKTMYATATSKFDPQVGDLVVSKQGQWQIVSVEDYKPSTVTIAFKWEIQ
jgi:hypothetical protein